MGEFAPHGNVHILTGGAYGCDQFDSLYEAGYIIDKETTTHLCVIWSPVFLKTAYRYHYITPKKNCLVNKPLTLPFLFLFVFLLAFFAHIS